MFRGLRRTQVKLKRQWASAFTFLTVLGLVVSLSLPDAGILPVGAQNAQVIPNSPLNTARDRKFVGLDKQGGKGRENRANPSSIDPSLKFPFSLGNLSPRLPVSPSPRLSPGKGGRQPGFRISSLFAQHSVQEQSEKFPIQSSQSHGLDRRGRELYGNGEFGAAAIAWQRAAIAYQTQGDRLNQAMALSNLSLAYQQLGQWSKATQAITDSLDLLKTEGEQGRSVLAQALNTQGGLQLALGQSEQALETWQQAENVYAQTEDRSGIIRSQINQAQALQALGLYRRALKTLTQVNQALETQPDSPLKAVGLRSLGNILRLVGDLDQSRQTLEQSLAIAEQLGSREDVEAALFSLGNRARAKGDSQAALAFYQQAAAVPTSTSTQIQTQLAQLSLWLETEQWEAAEALSPQIQEKLGNLPPSRMTIYAQINFANSLIRLKQKSATSQASWKAIAQLLADAVQQGKNLGDRRSEAYALGNLGKVYEQTQQWSIAQDLTRQALFLAQEINAPDIAYRWQWQLGRILKAEGDRQSAIAIYSEAVNTLKSLSSDLVAINSDVQFSFRESVEPVYRELLDLLLQPDSKNEISQENLTQALDVIESLQLAELNNFFREACLDAEPVPINEVDRKQQAAVIYPIILGDRLEVILSLPQQPLHHYTTSIPKGELEKVIDQLRKNLVIRSRRKFFPPSQKLYDWLIRPAAEDLAKSSVKIKTLVFVLDGPLRNIPMATLYDGDNYLVEKYRIALTPGLRLLSPRPLQQVELKILAAGLTQQKQDFSPLDYVREELEGIKDNLSTVVLLDQAFTREALRKELEFSAFRVVHLATHGQFSSNLAKTFILAWDSPINVKELDNILRGRTPLKEKAIELLVLSACETATGDERAALGLAGMAVRAGARSTVATLWSVNDEATAEFMGQFYQELATKQVTKAEALRQAQLTLLKSGYGLYRHPFYWAPYVLLGNWL